VTNPESLQLALFSWNNSRSLGDLADLLSFGVDPLLRDTLLEPAKFALTLENLPPAMRLVAQEILSPGDSDVLAWSSEGAAANVQKLRATLRIAPNDSIALVDLAQHHLANHKERAAYRCLSTALQLSPNSVYVIRAMARYWIHLDDFAKAHKFIKSAVLVNPDPWLMASEIAIAQGANATSTQLRKAQRAIATKSFSMKDVSELAAAVGGTELYSGNIKEARKLFRTALDAPNDNVLAQTMHLQAFLGIDVDEQLLRRAPNGVFEVRAYQAIVGADFVNAARLTAAWGDEEPFSSRPRVLESYVAGALGDYQAALISADLGLRSDPDDLTLRGNRAYALAGLLRFDEAEVELKSIDAKGEDRQEPLSTATKGMIELLRGNTAQGIALYEDALATFKKHGDQELVTTCRAFMARAAVTAQVPEASAILGEAKDRFKKSPAPAASVILRTLNHDMGPIATEPLRKVTQWEWDPASNTLQERKQVTRKGATGFIVKGRAQPR
jgi:tetratricopeptide (TPR) repeat protein